MERRRSTPLKSEPAAAMLLYGRRAPIPDLVHITPIKHPDRAHPAPEPWTPTANLKMLISAASPDIRDREMKKTLFRPIENERDKMAEPQVEEMDGEAEEPCQVATDSSLDPNTDSVHPLRESLVWFWR